MYGSRLFYITSLTSSLFISRLIQPTISLKEGDCFDYAPWGGACKVVFVNGVLRLYRSDRSPDTKICSWMCRNPKDTRTLMCGGKVMIIWDGKDQKPCQVLNNDTIAVTHGNTVYKFTRIQVSLCAPYQVFYIRIMACYIHQPWISLNFAFDSHK